MSDYDKSIHSNPDASVWAKEFIKTWAKVYPNQPAPDEGWMLGWFANAMCAQMDFDARKSATKAIPEKT
jgi:hypothetical protein